MYPPTAGNQSSHIVYTQYSWTALPRGSSPPSGLGLSHRRARRRTIYGKPCNAVGGVLRPSVAPIHLVSQAFPGLEAVGEQPLPGVDSVASAAAEAKLPPSPCALLAIWIGWPSPQGYHNFEKIVDGFTFDNKKYFEVLNAMHNGEGDEVNKNKCEECNFKTHSAGLLKLHASNSHQQTSE